MISVFAQKCYFLPLDEGIVCIDKERVGGEVKNILTL